MTKYKTWKTVILVTITAISIMACASKRSVEIGDPSLTSPEEHQHYLTINDAFSRHDTNGDGFLDQHEFDQLQGDPEIIRVRKSIAEIAESGPMLFTEIDENDDGFISLNELTIAIQPLLPPKN
jgi:Ca2+-binding EF-hand superfamily protein